MLQPRNLCIILLTHALVGPHLLLNLHTKGHSSQYRHHILVCIKGLSGDGGQYQQLMKVSLLPPGKALWA
jgi:hypothetical protein